MHRRLLRLLLLLILILAVLFGAGLAWGLWRGFEAPLPPGVGDPNLGLMPCPASPNCVSSQAETAEQRVEALPLLASPVFTLSRLKAAAAELPGSRLVKEQGGYLHYEIRSRWLGFVDDLELRINQGENRVEVRSASRLGYSDFDVNRRRVEELRRLLQD